VSRITPCHDSGSAVSSRSHSTMTASTSVNAGADCHVIPSAWPNGSAFSGARVGSLAATSPGATWAWTGSCGIRAR
jgi:hypothetical protein